MLSTPVYSTKLLSLLKDNLPISRSTNLVLHYCSCSSSSLGVSVKFGRTCSVRLWARRSPWICARALDSLPFSWWPWRRWKDFNPQWNFLIPATCHHVRWPHTAAGLPVGDSLHGFDTVNAWSGRGGTNILENSRLNAFSGVFFVGAVGTSLEATEVGRPKRSRCFCFHFLRTFGIYRRPHKRSLQLHFIRPPPPVRTSKVAPHLHQNEELQTQRPSLCLFCMLQCLHLRTVFPSSVRQGNVLDL